MSEKNNTQAQIKISITNKEYLVNCPQGKESALISAASILNSRLSQVKAGTLQEIEQNLIMTALNICHELNTCRREFEQYKAQTQIKLSDVQQKIDKAHVG